MRRRALTGGLGFMVLVDVLLVLAQSGHSCQAPP